MNRFAIGIIIAAVLILWIEIKNRRERPIFRQVEEAFKELLAGRFEREPLHRRRFMRALAHYASGEKGTQMAYVLAGSTLKRCHAPEDITACLILCGLCLEDMGRAEEALELFEEACEREPDFIIAKEKRAHVLSVMADPKAADAYAEVVALCPDDNVYLNNYASALIRLNQNREAVAQLEILLKRDAGFGNAYALLALAYARLRDFESMEKTIAAAVAHGMDENELRAILDADQSKQ